jgi:CheY-like chemotaxis protein
MMPPNSSQQRFRLLLIDDEPLVLAALRRTLGVEFTLSTCSSGLEAITLLRRGERFDVVLCDLMMPEMTGMEFFDVLGVSYPNLTSRVVFLTGGAVTPRARNFVATVNNTVLHKPCEAALLRAVLRRVSSLPLEERVSEPGSA